MPSVTKQLDRKLGFLSVYSIAVGAMLGSGIFVLPGLVFVMAVDLAWPLVVLEGKSPLEAMGMAARHFKSHLAWHLGYYLILFSLAFVVFDRTADLRRDSADRQRAFEATWGTLYPMRGDLPSGGGPRTKV